VNRGMMDVNSLPKTVTRQCHGCDLNPGPSAIESSTLTTRSITDVFLMQGKIRHGHNGWFTWFTWRHSGHEYVHKYSKFTMNQLHSSSRRGYQKLEQQYWMRLASPNCMKKQQSTAEYALSSLLIKLLCLQCFTVNLIENAENR